MMSFPRLLLLVLLVLAPAVGPATADHAFSNRVEVVGRVVDHEGYPVPGADISITFEDVPVMGRCYDAREERTDETGDYRICRMAKELHRDGNVTVEVLGARVTVPLEAALRRAYAPVVLDGPTPRHSIQGERVFFHNYTVTGRLMDAAPRPVDVEGVLVNATPGGERNVTVTLVDATGAVVARAVATTDGAGDFRADLFLEEVPAGGRVRIDAGYLGAGTEANGTLRRSDLVIFRAPEQLPDIPHPGRSVGPLPWPGLVALAALCLLAAALTLRRR